MGAKTKIPDFGGYATKNDLRCSDGRIIRHGAFKHNHNKKVPLVWGHLHNDPTNFLGHAMLENRDDGVYAYCYLNDSEQAQHAGELVRHGDINALSIYANKLVEKDNNVMHGEIREVSLVMAGANPGALIDQTTLSHSDDPDLNEAIIYTGTFIDDDPEFMHEDAPSEEEKKMDNENVNEDKNEEFDPGEVYHSMNEKQQRLLKMLVADALEQGDDEEIDHSDHTEGGEMTHYNVFENQTPQESPATLSHSDLMAIVDDGVRMGSIRESFMAHAQDYGIQNLELLFPDAKALEETPQFIQRQQEWVGKVLAGTRKTPFSRVKTLFANITHDEARARGYITGDLKKEEYFDLVGRETHPTTVYKKQKMDRDDLIDIQSIDVISWLKSEMRLMLNEEIARAILFGDGREPDDPSHIDPKKIRPIVTDHEFFTRKGTALDTSTNEKTINAIHKMSREIRDMKGTPGKTLFAPSDLISDFLYVVDKDNKRIYNNVEEVARALGVKEIVEPDVPTKVAVVVNLNDYVVGTDRGGEINFFDDFDIDFNQNKYLIESRMSGALVQPKSALVFDLKKTYDGTGVVDTPDFGDDKVAPRKTRRTVHDEGVVSNVSKAAEDSGVVGD